MGANPSDRASSKQRFEREPSSPPWPLAFIGFIIALYFNDRSMRYKSYRAALANAADAARPRRSRTKPLLLLLFAVLALFAIGAALYLALSAPPVDPPLASLQPIAPSATPDAVLTAVARILTTTTTVEELLKDKDAPGPTDPQVYLKDTLDYIQKNSLMDIHWAAWRAKVIAEAGKPLTRSDTHFAIKDALEMLGDNHSQLWEPERYLRSQQNVLDGYGILPPYPERYYHLVHDVYDSGLHFRIYDLVQGHQSRQLEIYRAVRDGDVIEAINGRPAASMGASTFYRNLRGGSHVQLTIRRMDVATPITVTWDHPYLSPYLIPEGRRLEGNIGYIRLPSHGSGHIEEEYAEIVQQIIKDLDQPAACGWVVDLQDNNGGYMGSMLAGIGPILGEGAAGTFIDKQGKRSAWSYRLDPDHWAGKVFVGTGVLSAVVVPYLYKLKHPMPPVAVLTDRWTASAGEAVLVSFRGRPNTRTFGEPTLGIPTANSGKVLSDWASLIVTSAQEADRTGRVYGVHERIQPDQPVTPGSPDDQGTDADPVLAAGAKWLREQPACGK